jgi:hypothetical protein
MTSVERETGTAHSVLEVGSLVEKIATRRLGDLLPQDEPALDAAPK